jgi:hypothetical protein
MADSIVKDLRGELNGIVRSKCATTRSFAYGYSKLKKGVEAKTFKPFIIAKASERELRIAIKEASNI